MSTKNIFSVKTTDAGVLGSKGGNYGKFGLNKGFITNLSYVEDKSKSGEAYKAIKLSVKIDEGEYNHLIFLSQEIYENDKPFGTAQLLSPGMEGYEEAFYAHYIQHIAVIKHALHALGVTDETIDKAMEGAGMDNFLDSIKKLVSLAPADYDKKPVDIFLEYEWAIREGKDKTYPVLPKNMKGGQFLIASVEGNWTPVEDANGLHYTDEAGNRHPFTRNSNFMKGNKGVQQVLQAVAPSPILPTANTTAKW